MLVQINTAACRGSMGFAALQWADPSNLRRDNPPPPKRREDNSPPDKKKSFCAQQKRAPAKRTDRLCQTKVGSACTALLKPPPPWSASCGGPQTLRTTAPSSPWRRIGSQARHSENWQIWKWRKGYLYPRHPSDPVSSILHIA